MTQKASSNASSVTRGSTASWIASTSPRSPACSPVQSALVGGGPCHPARPVKPDLASRTPGRAASASQTVEDGPPASTREGGAVSRGPVKACTGHARPAAPSLECAWRGLEGSGAPARVTTYATPSHSGAASSKLRMAGAAGSGRAAGGRAPLGTQSREEASTNSSCASRACSGPAVGPAIGPAVGPAGEPIA
eukprot:scaffold21907_cov57-Phaeocystis_antarctica.AAC.5